jgi:hypothetical protein
MNEVHVNMSLVPAVCPKCDFRSRVDDSLIFRYTDCDRCGCRFYVNAPPAGQDADIVETVDSGSPVSDPRATKRWTLWRRDDGASLRETLRRQTRLLQAILLLEVIVGAMLLALLVRAFF